MCFDSGSLARMQNINDLEFLKEMKNYPILFS